MIEVFKLKKEETKGRWDTQREVGSPRDVVVNVLDCNIVVSEFEFQSCYYVDFPTNTLGKDMYLVISVSMG